MRVFGVVCSWRSSRISDTKFMHPSTSDLYNLIVTDTRAP
jgi:hypothetical protein